MPKRTNTDADTGPAAGTGDVPPLDDKSQQILAALAELGEATAAGLATHLGIGYSTTTPKLRKLNEHGLAETGKADNGQTVWRLTDAGSAHPTATSRENGTADHGPASDTTAQDAAATTDPADDTDSRPEPDVTTSVSSAPGDAVEEVAVEDDAVDDDDDGGASDGATADESGAVCADDLVAATASDLAARDSDDDRATADAASETPVAVSDDGDDGGDPAGENVDDTADQTPAEATDDDAAGGTGSAPGTAPDATIGADDAAAPAAAPTGATATGKVRRPSGSLDKAVLAILQARPDMVFKVGELCKLINKAEEGTGMSPASPGAVVLAAQRLVARQQAILAVEKPASFQLLPGTAEHAAPAAQPDTAESQTGTQSEAVDAVTVG